MSKKGPPPPSDASSRELTSSEARAAGVPRTTRIWNHGDGRITLWQRPPGRLGYEMSHGPKSGAVIKLIGYWEND